VRYIVFITIISGLASCTSRSGDVRIVSSSEEPQNELLGVIGQTLEDQLGYSTSIIVGNDSYSNIDSILNDRADIAIVENFAPYMPGVNTIMPLYEQILHVFYNKDIKVSSFKSLCEGRSMYIGEKGSATYILMNKLFTSFEVDTSLVNISYEIFEQVDVFCAFTHIIRNEDLQGMEDFMLFSFDRVDHIGKGSIIEGICLKNPYLSPFVIPNQLYNENNSTPVLTLSSMALLVGKETLPRDMVYDIIKTLRSSRLQLGREGTLAMMDFNDSYNLHRINFPLHEGAMDYLDRHQPSFLERYAEVISVLVSIIIAFGSAIFTFNGWNKQRKKNRVDMFYAKILDIKTLSENTTSVIDLMQLIGKIQDIQKEAFEMLMREKLIADESFRIFVELSKDTLHSLESKMEHLQADMVAI